MNRCVRPTKFWPNTNRLFSCDNQVLPDDYWHNSRVKTIVSLLRDYDFTDRQIDCVFKKIGKYVVEENGLNSKAMTETIDCWRSSIKAPKLRPNQWDKISPEDIDYDMSVDLNHVLSQIEPKLLLINANAIEHRIKNIKELAIFGGSRDLWRALVYAPNGYYLQSWPDFLKKYHYLNFRVLEWLLDKKDKDNLHPHPLIRNARVMELPFESIRSRYLFAKRTGLKTISINHKLSNQEMSAIDLKALLLTPIDKYLKLVTENLCSVEEYSALETLLNDMPPDEEEQLIEEIVELTVPVTRDFNKLTNQQKKDNYRSMKNNYQIISKIE